MNSVKETMKKVVTNYQDINGLMNAQFELAQIGYTMAEEYAYKRKKSKLLTKKIADEENNLFLSYNMQSGINTTTARAMAKNEASTKNAKEEKEVIELEADYKGNDVKIRQINKFLSAINQQVACLRQEKQQTNYHQNG